MLSIFLIDIDNENTTHYFIYNIEVIYQPASLGANVEQTLPHKLWVGVFVKIKVNGTGYLGISQVKNYQIIFFMYTKLSF